MNVLAALEAAPLPGRHRFAAWAEAEPALAGLTPYDLRGVLLDDTQPVDYDRRDDILAALIRLSHSDDQAHTLLVTCLLPGLRTRLVRHGWGLDHEEAAAIALTALCQRIHNYPLLRRPRRIAMNLLLDTAHDLITARDKELEHRANAVPTDRHLDRAVDQPDSVTENLLWAATRQAGILNDREIALIRATRLEDLPITAVAPLLAMGHEAARKARQRALHKLKTWWDSAVA